MSDTACPSVVATLKEVDGRDLRPSLALPWGERPRRRDDSGDHIGLTGVLVGCVPVNESVEHISGDVGVNRSAISELPTRFRATNDDAVLAQKVIEHPWMDIPAPPVGALAKLEGQLVTLS